MQGYPIRGRGGGGVQSVASWVLAEWQAGDNDEPQGTRYTELQSEDPHQGPPFGGPCSTPALLAAGGTTNLYSLAPLHDVARQTMQGQ